MRVSELEGLVMTRLQTAIDQIRFARNYTLRLLNHTKEDDWFKMPGGITHVAWQVGHLATSQYRMVFERVRGGRPEDAELMSDDFRKPFIRDSVPSEASAYPSCSEIRTVFDRMHERVMVWLPTLNETELDQPILTPHSLVKSKFEALMWCGQHEFVHAGQIGLIRRLLGCPPVW
jgi:DinB superfamily